MPQHATSDPFTPAVEAYVWGYPLAAIQRTRLLLCSKTPTGIVNHIDDLATPADRAIVVPNNDTLYSSGWYDLSHGDLQIDVPAMDHPTRYWNVMIMDAYGHQAYVCRRHHGVAGTRVRVTLDPQTQPRYDNSPVVTVGTPTVWVILRVLVESPADIEAARSMQRAIRITAPTAHPNATTERAGRATAITKAGAAFFPELQSYLERDPPASWHPQLSPAARDLLQDPAQFSEAALVNAIDQGEALIARSAGTDTVVRNGWRTGREAHGFGADIAKRAAAAKFGLGGHQAIENRSYTALSDAQRRPLDGSRSLSLQFAGDDLPPCSGFWSLTAYGTDMYLVDNPIDRWSISDRTPGLQYAKDGSLTIMLSATQPANTANWLPVPAGPYLLGLRVYEGHASVVDCDWFPPALVDSGQ